MNTSPANNTEQYGNDLLAIVGSGILAPSGDNVQPWRFAIGHGRIDLFNDPATGESPFNFRQRASLISHGCVIENMLLAAAALGYYVDLDLLPSSKRPNCVASLHFRSGAPAEAPLYSFIRRRTTDRRFYQPGYNVDGRVMDSFNKSAALFPNLALHILSGRQKDALAPYLALNQTSMSWSDQIYSYFSQEMRWTEEHAVSSGDGLDARTLGMEKSEIFMLRLVVRNWSLFRLFRAVVGAVGGAKLAALVRKSSAIGAIFIPDASPASYVNCGRLLQRTWLEAARAGLSFQCIGGLGLLWQMFADGNYADFTPRARAKLLSAQEAVSKGFGSDGRTPGIIFRIGKTASLPVASLRRPLASFLEEHG